MRMKNKEALDLLDTWLADESGDQERTWPRLKKRLKDPYDEQKAPIDNFAPLQEMVLRLSQEVGWLRVQNAIMKEALEKISAGWMTSSSDEAASIADAALEKTECSHQAL